MRPLIDLTAGGDGPQGAVDGHERAGALHEACAEVPGHDGGGRVQKVSEKCRASQENSSAIAF